MKSYLPAAISFVLRLSLLNCILPVESICRVSGVNVYQRGERLSLSCHCIGCSRITWFLNESPVTDNGNSPNFTKDNVTPKDSGDYSCKCNGDDKVVYNVLVFEATLVASLHEDNCSVAVILTVSARQQFSVLNFTFPTLESGSYKIWNFSMVRDHEGSHVIRMLAVGNPGGSVNHTCNFAVEHHLNGRNTKTVSETVHLPGEAKKCINSTPTSSALIQGNHTTGHRPTTSQAARNSIHLTVALMVSILLYCLLKW